MIKLIWVKKKVQSKVQNISVRIYFYDGNYKTYTVTRPAYPPPQFVVCYKHFYKWFFGRPETPYFCFAHENGEDIFYRKDIKMVSFYYH